MKKVSIFALSALLVAALSVPAMAKVNLSGAMWTTFWAQQEGSVQTQIAGGGLWSDNSPNADVVGSNPLTANMGTRAAASKKTFLVGQNMSGNGVTAKATRGYGFQLVADCPVNDWVKAYGDFNVMNAGNLALVEGYINLAFMKEFNVRAGRMQVPFGHERTTRPTAGQDEVFVSDYTQDANGVLLRTYDVGVQAFGTLASGMVDYSLFVGNGVLNSVSDSGGMLAASQATPDIDDAKQYGINIVARPFTGAFVGGSYFGGDFTNTNPSLRESRAKYTAYDLNAGYEYGNIFAVSAEYATSRADKLTLDYALGTVAGSNQLEEARVNEYILKAVYTGVADWEFGVRYGAVDPKSIEAEQLAGFSMEKKVSFAAGYRFARAAFLKAEYSWVDTDFNNYDSIANVAGRVRQVPSQDVDDNILALSLGLQF